MIASLLAAHPIVLAPMEDVTGAPFRAACRAVGATWCVTELVGVEQIVADSALARRKATLADDDRPTSIQIYGADAELLVAAARIAARAQPIAIDLNCGCWVPAIARRGAGAGWLRRPAAMVEMARRIVAEVDVPVTVKTRIGWGPESDMPIVDLARRLEDAGVAAIAVHCRTALAGHTGLADWQWAARAAAAVTIPVIVNGDVRTAADAVRALAETGCAGVMIGRAAIEHPWIFREARALCEGRTVAPPSTDERVALYRALLHANVAARGERHGVAVTKRHLGMLGACTELRRATRLADALALLDRYGLLLPNDIERSTGVVGRTERAQRKPTCENLRSPS